MLEPSPIPNMAWSTISMDFIEGLPNLKGKDTILVVGDFVALSHPFTVLTIAYEYLIHIYKLYGIPDYIELFKRLRTKLHLSNAYQPETDGQAKVLNCNILKNPSVTTV
ncbi:polyprotein [Gossypium australe]|uniref:Polyprotein n=1 Tax=Gossypium australe TaxID=47621 RepID=A0A5B6WP41_9ROSI|nr:polyprotein [Gossypium australe]